ncbi:hypothetical protein ACFO9Q_04545 [Paenibacillus sp. GCM10023252]|uniref:hypothetical protein n=1 Tax=Paenibacillus sp. GCM10023252 TaxID=3252649 RepID=UPI00360FDA6B
MTPSSNRLQRITQSAPKWVQGLMPLLALLISVLVLYLTWHFYQGFLISAPFNWTDWIQPALMTLGAFLGLLAAVLLFMQRREGWDVLTASLSLIPTVLAWRLILVVSAWLSSLGGGGNGSRMSISLLDTLIIIMAGAGGAFALWTKYRRRST